MRLLLPKHPLCCPRSASAMIVVVVAVLVAAIAVAAVWWGLSADAPQAVAERPQQTRVSSCDGTVPDVDAASAITGQSDADAVATRPPSTRLVDSGVVASLNDSGDQSPTDASPVLPAEETAETPRTERPAPIDYGTIEAVKAADYPQVALAIEALKTGKHPERLSPMIAPPPFDQAAYDQDSEAYLKDIAPGRCFLVAAPGPDVPVLRPVGPRAQRARQDQQITLKVRGKPLDPVTFTSMHAGYFSNRYPTQTVAANLEGVATVVYTPGSGVTNDVRIVAGSPTASETVSFLVVVTPPNMEPVAATEPAESQTPSDTTTTPTSTRTPDSPR